MILFRIKQFVIFEKIKKPIKPKNMPLKNINRKYNHLKS